MFRIEIDGRTPDADALSAALLNQYGHFTAMQVRDRKVRGLDLHLARLGAATRELFGTTLDPELVRHHVRHALTEEYADSSVRVQILGMNPADGPSIVVIAGPPVDMSPDPQRLRTVRYQRPVPHIKQVGGGFAQHYHGVAAERDGYADAVLTADDGAVSETTIANLAFSDGETLIWPAAPALAGVTKHLLERHGPAAGLPSAHRPVTLATAADFPAAIVANSRGIAPVSAIDERRFTVDHSLMTTLYRVYESVPWDDL